ncbi:Dihydroorotase and related cyclic amidoHydrolase [Hahella chejuensis KCTC 2396]|uniref:Dihydroorotase and related cyclic amidoHydrolase n=1 Tax=Hahella chejuensis (strain KCTC 2396) TaxID=349521 RepID=Q2SLC1_HAHCH|nr:dihydroorotase [Hahella chejuensis]ABC28553.1 Dihydroorotase and related cyclic amidoHydrolase [Hahella chejuensis KCTC 2396]
MSATLIKHARVVNEGLIREMDLRIVGSIIEKIATDIRAEHTDRIIEAAGCYLLPGMIDDQVHFREPGFTYKGTIASESLAAVVGGITSYMEMPNVNPATITIEALNQKYAIAAKRSYANYAFYLGATEDNLAQIQQLDPARHCGVKVFMGASTGGLLVEAPQALEAIFRESPVLIVTHCESNSVIQKSREALLRSKAVLTIEDHPRIRNVNACYESSSYAVSLAKRYQSQLHVLHITTAKELGLFEPGSIENKHITSEACVHHLWFSEEDYASLGNLIKCNPSIKSRSDRDALIQGLHTNQIDIIATDHAPHTLEEKQLDYDQAPAGLPLVQHALLSLLEHVRHGRLSLTQVVEKTAHNPAIRYAITGRGFIREGYYADLVLIDSQSSTTITHENSLYHCAWTPFVGQVFSSRIKSTWVNGQRMFGDDGVVSGKPSAMALAFSR